MPSTSKAQQKLFGWALACKRGESTHCPVNVKKLADSMSAEELEKFASTKHEGLPDKVREAALDCVMEMTEEDVNNLLQEAEEHVDESQKISDVPPISHDNKANPPIAPNPDLPPGYPPASKKDPVAFFTPRLFKMPMHDSKHERRLMDFEEFLKRINYRTHDGILQKGHGQNLTGKG
jgi:hypothetical protein